MYVAYVKDEATIRETYFVYVTSRPHGGSTYSCRFNSRAHAERVARAMNKAWEEEGVLYVSGDGSEKQR